MSSKSFADLGVSAVVVDALRARDITDPFAIQHLVIPDVLAGHDVLAKSPTGSGKTLAFADPDRRAPAGDRSPPGRASILAPTRELALQIVDDMHDIAHARALSVAAVYGGAGIQRQIQQARKAHIIVATPGRLEDILQRRAITLEHVKILVLDEADRMLDMGFRPAVDRIVARTPRTRQTLFFSATLEGDAGTIAKRLHERRAPPRARPGRRPRAPETEHRFVKRPARGQGRRSSSHELKRRRARPDDRLRAHQARRRPPRQAPAATTTSPRVAMHGDKTQSQREKALARFERGEVDTLVATDVAARGIDVRDVTHVINYDMPEDRDGYVHRTGRTGRAGALGHQRDVRPRRPGARHEPDRDATSACTRSSRSAGCRPRRAVAAVAVAGSVAGGGASGHAAAAAATGRRERAAPRPVALGSPQPVAAAAAAALAGGAATRRGSPVARGWPAWLATVRLAFAR